MQRLTALALSASLALSGCALTKPGGLNTPEGQLEKETIYGVTMLGCSEAAETDAAIKIDAGLALVQQLLVNKATNAEAVQGLDALKLSRRWRNRLLVTLRLSQRWVSTQIDQEAALTQIGETITNACREGLGQIA